MVYFDHNVEIKYYDLSLEEIIIKKEYYRGIPFGLGISNNSYESARKNYVIFVFLVFIYVICFSIIINVLFK